MSNLLLVYHGRPFIAQTLKEKLALIFPELRILAVSSDLQATSRFNSVEIKKYLLFDFDNLSYKERGLIDLVRARSPEVTFLALSNFDRSYIREIFGLQDSDTVINGNLGFSELIDRLKNLISPPAHADLVRYVAERPRLTARQIQLLTLIQRGYNNQEISKILKITENTVKVHLWRLYKKMNADNRVHAVHQARKWAFLD